MFWLAFCCVFMVFESSSYFLGSFFGIGLCFFEGLLTGL